MRFILYPVCVFLCMGIFFSASMAQQSLSTPDGHNEEKINALLKELSLDEKIALCHAQSRFSVKGVPRLGIPELWMSDGPHGVRMEIEWDSWKHAGWTSDSCTAFPALTCLAASFDPALSYQYGKAIGEEARYRKKDVLLGPGVNIYRTPMNGRNFEYMGEDPLLVSKMVVPYIQGVQLNGVAACLKHFALNNQEHDRKKINVVVSDRVLNEIYFPAFKAGVLQGHVWAVMAAYNKYRNEYCGQNAYLINEVLKKRWGYNGIVMTDWGTLDNTRTAALSGLDIEMGTRTNGLDKGAFAAYDDYYLARGFKKAIVDGTIDQSVLDEKVKRILRLHFRTTLNRQKPLGSFATKEHLEVAQRVAEAGVVLLKNNQQLLPIRKGNFKRILVVGENAAREFTSGGGSSELKPWVEISILQGLYQQYGKEAIEFAMGYSSAQNEERGGDAHVRDSLFQDAVRKAAAAEVVIFVGGLNKSYHQDSEGGDRLDYNLPYGQNELIRELLKVNKKTALVLISGNGYAMPWISQANTLLQSWYLGSASGTAIARIISGEVNPSGKLPFSITKNLNDLGAHYWGESSYPGKDGNVIYKEDVLVGYRWLDTKKITPLFEFGYGLSYTNFKISAAQTDKSIYSKNDTLTLTCTIKNTGAYAGAEVVQVYLSQKKPALIRPEKELKGFCKVQLAAGEDKVVSIQLPVKEFAYFDDRIGQWVVDADRFTLHIGRSSRIIEKQISVVVY
ncbi:MAG: glycoside hydrolase family 3 C-terminal domain-containing protein [Niabella sp.]